MEDHIELRGNAALLAQILEATSGGVWDWNIPSGNAVFSSGYAIMLGYEPEEFPKDYKSWSRLVHPHDLYRVKQAHADHIVRHKDFSVEFRMREKSGDWHWIHSRGILIGRDAQGKPMRMVGTHTDIQERKLAEEALTVVSRKLLEAQELERSRIGRELHDDINQRLALLSAEIQRMKEVSPVTYGELRSRLDELGKRTSEISAVVQSLSHELHSSRLEYLGLVSAMKGFCKEVGDKHKVEIDFNAEGVPSGVPPEVSLCLFRVMQEGLQNALKHSGVRLFEVKLHGSPTEIRLTVRDSGAGFDPELARKTQGLGLISMRERVRLVKGRISITSRPQAGTEINVRIPLSAGAQTEQAKLPGA